MDNISHNPPYPQLKYIVGIFFISSCPFLSL
nr:MAG TPA: 5-aminolevulinate synthase [Caudoviricetes sp.]